jgi:hypothetical protein
LNETHNQAQGSATLGVDQEEGGDSGDDLNGTVAERGVQGLNVAVAGILEDGGGVEGDDCASAISDLASGDR